MCAQIFITIGPIKKIGSAVPFSFLDIQEKILAVRTLIFFLQIHINKLELHYLS